MESNPPALPPPLFNALGFPNPAPPPTDVNFAAAPRPLKVTLMDGPSFPMETIYCAWMISRTEDGAWDPKALHENIEREKNAAYAKAYHEWMDGPIPPDEGERMATPPPGPLESEVRRVFMDVIDLKIQLAETLDFVFVVDNISIPLREQMVRHRVGVKFGPRLGVDFIPELGGSTWWSQTMRILDMSKFLEKGHYHMAETIGNQKASKEADGKDFTAKELYIGILKQCQDAYARLVEIGVPAEDARSLLPMAVTHRLTWKINLSAILHILGKRSCWITQLGLWQPVIFQMIDELATKVDPFFRLLVSPPCIDRKRGFEKCLYRAENDGRIAGKDPLPPCPLYLHHHEKEAVEGASEYGSAWIPLTIDGKDRRQFAGRVIGWQAPTEREGHYATGKAEEYRKFWGRDTNTGELLQKGNE